MTFFDEKTSARVEALYQTKDAVRRRRTVLEALRLTPGERVLDIGTGPGFVAYEMADAVGATGTVVGVDSSEPMLGLARKRCANQPWVTFQRGEATKLTADDASFDVAVSIQVYEYVANVEAALAEMYRVLRPGGRGAIISTDWTTIAFNSTDETRMRRILAAFAEHCPHQDLPRSLAPKLRAAGFSCDRVEAVPVFNAVYDPNTFSYHVVGLISAFVPGRKGLTAEEVTAWAEDLHDVGRQGHWFFNSNQYLFLVSKPSA